MVCFSYLSTEEKKETMERRSSTNLWHFSFHCLFRIHYQTGEKKEESNGVGERLALQYTTLEIDDDTKAFFFSLSASFSRVTE